MNSHQVDKNNWKRIKNSNIINILNPKSKEFGTGYIYYNISGLERAHGRSGAEPKRLRERRRGRGWGRAEFGVT